MPLLLEYFKPYKSFQVSNMGRVVGRKGKDITQRLNTSGYLLVWDSNGAYLVHRLVAKLFVPNPHPELFNQVDHQNSIRTDNRVGNLSWCSQSMNMLASYERRRSQGMSACTDKHLAALRRNLIKAHYVRSSPVIYRGQTYVSQSALARDFNVTNTTISGALKKGTWRGHPIRFAA